MRAHRNRYIRIPLLIALLKPKKTPNKQKGERRSAHRGSLGHFGAARASPPRPDYSTPGMMISRGFPARPPRWGRGQPPPRIPPPRPALRCAEPRGAARPGPAGDAPAAVPVPRPPFPSLRLTPPWGRPRPAARPSAPRTQRRPPAARPSAPRAQRRRRQVGARRGGCAARPLPCRARWDS